MLEFLRKHNILLFFQFPFDFMFFYWYHKSIHCCIYITFSYRHKHEKSIDIGIMSVNVINLISNKLGEKAIIHYKIASGSFPCLCHNMYNCVTNKIFIDSENNKKSMKWRRVLLHNFCITFSILIARYKSILTLTITWFW